MERKFYYDAKTKWLHSGGKMDDHPSGGVGKLYYETVKKHAETDLIAQIQYETGEEESYKTFFAKTVKIALYLRERGIKPGDIISMSSRNNMFNSAVFMATFFDGVILASTDPMMSVEDTKYLLELVEPKLIFVCDKSFDLIKKATQGKKKIIPLYEHDSLENISAILEKYTEDDINSFQPYCDADNKDTALILFSSGTTGMPKAACLTHDMLFVDKSSMFLPGTRITNFTTLYWASSAVFTIGIFFVGSIKINVLEVALEDIWNFLNKSKVNFTFMVYANVINGVQYLKEPMPHLKWLFMGGGILPARYQKELKEKLPNANVINAYGTTEIGGVTVNPGVCTPQSVGVLMARDVILKIVDVNTEEAVDIGVLGEIHVKGKHQMKGYYKHDNTDVWDADGFYKTGDLGYLNEKYELFIVDRIKEMFKCSGHLVIPAKIESVMNKHPSVNLAIVIGVPFNISDNITKAFVVLKDGSTITEDELVKYTNDNIEDSRNHLKAGIQFLSNDDIPYTVTGKVNRRLLRQKYAK